MYLSRNGAVYLRKWDSVINCIVVYLAPFANRHCITYFVQLQDVVLETEFDEEKSKFTMKQVCLDTCILLIVDIC